MTPKWKIVTLKRLFIVVELRVMVYVFFLFQCFFMYGSLWFLHLISSLLCLVLCYFCFALSLSLSFYSVPNPTHTHDFDKWRHVSFNASRQREQKTNFVNFFVIFETTLFYFILISAECVSTLFASFFPTTKKKWHKVFVCVCQFDSIRRGFSLCHLEIVEMNILMG